MATTAFDTLSAVQDLEAAGIERKHAEAIAKVVNPGDERAAAGVRRPGYNPARSRLSVSPHTGMVGGLRIRGDSSMFQSPPLSSGRGA